MLLLTVLTPAGASAPPAMIGQNSPPRTTQICMKRGTGKYRTFVVGKCKGMFMTYQIIKKSLEGEYVFPATLCLPGSGMLC